MANNKTKNSIEKSTQDIFNKENIMYVIYLALIVLPLYFKGAYFENAYLPFIIGVSILFMFHIKSRYKGSKLGLIQNDSDLFLIGLVLLYSLTFFYGVNKRASLIEFSKYAGYMAVFFLSRDIGKDSKKRNITIDIIILAGIVVSIIGMGSMIGTWEYTDAYMGTRLASTFQYPNTLAAYASALYFLAMGKAILEENKWKLFLYGGSLTVFFSTVIFTASRGMWLLFPVILLAYFIIINKKDKVTLFFYSLLNLILAVPFSFIFLQYLEKSENILWGMYIGGAIISGLIFYVLGLGDKIVRKIPIKAVFIVILVLGIGAAGLGYYAINTTVPLTLENTTDEAKTLNLIRSSNDVFPDTEYILNIEGVADKPEEKSYAGRVVLYSTNDKGENTHISTHNIVENGEYNLDYSFKTLEDTKSVRVYFQNRIENTSITFDSAKLVDTVTDETVDIPLKYKYIPEGIVSRVMSINLTDNSSQARIIFSMDALRLVKQNPILGSGGDGWATTYKTVQTYPYWSKHVHNYFLQMMVEIGLLGIMLFGGFIGFIIYAYIRYKRSDETLDRTLSDTLAIAIFAILGHAMIDFDLSLVSVAITLWALFGLFASTIYSVEKDEDILMSKLGKNTRKIRVVPTVLIVVALLISASIYTGSIFVDKAIAAQDEGDIDGLQKNMERASSLDPYNTKYKVELINIYFYQNSNSTDSNINYGLKAKNIADRLLEIGKYDPIVVGNVSQSYMTMGLLDEGISLVDKMVEMQPLTVEAYAQKAKTYLSLFNHYIKQGELDKAESLAKKASILESQLKEAHEKSIRPISIDNELNLDILKLKYLGEKFSDYIAHLERNEKIVYYYDFNIDINNDEEIDMLRSSIPEGSKIEHQAMIEDENSFARISNEGEVYGFKYFYPITLQPNTDYIVEFYARGNTEPKTFNVYAWSGGTEDPNQGNLTGIEVDSEWRRYRFEFTTDSDVEPGGEYIRIQHNGNDSGHFDIRDLTIFNK